MLIDVFKETKAPLKIITAQSHAGSDYTNLKEKCAPISNIEVIITENSGEVYPMMVKEMANAKAIVCPLRQDKLNYCVGLSTIADAEGLGKPLIITKNPLQLFFYVIKTISFRKGLSGQRTGCPNRHFPHLTPIFRI